MKLQTRLQNHIRSKYPDSDALFKIDCFDELGRELADIGRSMPKNNADYWLLLAGAAAMSVTAWIIVAAFR